MPTKYCEVCATNVVNLSRHIKSQKHKRFQEWQEYGNYAEEEWQEHNNNIRKQFNDKHHTTFLTYLYAFFAYIISLMCFKRVQG